MSALGVIAIVASCVRAFHNGSEFVTRLQARGADEHDGQPLSTRESIMQEMLQESMTEGQQAISTHFKEEQKTLGEHSHLLQKGDDIAKQELLSITVTLQDEILDKIGHDRKQSNLAEDLKSLHATAIAKRHEAIRSITELRVRIENGLSAAGKSEHDLNRKGSINSMPAAFASDVVDSSQQRRSSKEQQGPDRIQNLTGSLLPIPEIKADDIDTLTIQESVLDDDRFTIAPEVPYKASRGPPAAHHQPQPRHLNHFNFSSAASMRAADAPESMQPPVQPAVPLERLGPYFPDSPPNVADQSVPVLPPKSRRDRPSVPDSQIPRSDSMPWATRIFSIPSPSSSPRISEPDSAISFKMHSSKPYCNGAVAAQEDFIAGFMRNFLPVLPGSDKKELCWKCKECDFNASDAEGQLFERIEFKFGIRFRFKFLARSHVPYTHPKDSLKPRYSYGCLFCTAEGSKQAAIHTSLENLMSHISDKHHTQLTPDVRERTRCVIGKLADRDADWDCNFPDVSIKRKGFRNFMIHAVTSLPT